MTTQQKQKERETAVIRAPHDGSEVGVVALAGPEDVRAALDASVAAARASRLMPSHARAAALRKVADGLEAARAEFARTLALEAGKLFHIDLNDQKPGRFDQDLRFGSEAIKPMFFLVKLLEESGYDGPRHFDAHAYRTEDADGVWDFARGCMRTYLILKDKAKQFCADKEIQALLAEIRADEGPAKAGHYEGKSGKSRTLRTIFISRRGFCRAAASRASRPARRRRPRRGRARRRRARG